MSSHDSSLPEPWVERIFATMRATYGAAFDRQWECPPGVDPVDYGRQLKAHWGRELRGYQQNPKAIGHALDHLPPHPPNLIEFKALCRGNPAKALALPAPDFSTEAAQKALSGLAKPAAGFDPKAWARRLQQREAAGAKLSIWQKSAWRDALGVPSGPGAAQ